MPDKLSADDFLVTLNNCHSSVKFTMEIENGRMLPFLGTQLLNKSSQTHKHWPSASARAMLTITRSVAY